MNGAGWPQLSAVVVLLFYIKKTSSFMVQRQFADEVVKIVQADLEVLGLAAAGSFITDELDEFSDLDLLLVTRNRIAGNKDQMLAYAHRFGHILSAFTGEHVGEPRVLICLYDQPLLHVDIKFLTLEEFGCRVETPIVLFEREKALSTILAATQAHWPAPDQQWLEDRFWVWVHYAATKLGRGEYFEALDFLAFLRGTVLAPLLQLKNNQLPRGLRKVERVLTGPDLTFLQATLAPYHPAAIGHAVQQAVALYLSLRNSVFSSEVVVHQEAQQQVEHYLSQIIARL